MQLGMEDFRWFKAIGVNLKQCFYRFAIFLLFILGSRT